jgi:hypothetical protein
MCLNRVYNITPPDTAIAGHNQCPRTRTKPRRPKTKSHKLNAKQMCLTTSKQVKSAKYNKVSVIKIFKRDAHNNELYGLVYGLNPILVNARNKSSDTVLHDDNWDEYPSGYHGYKNTKSAYMKCVDAVINNLSHTYRYEIWRCVLDDVHTVGIEHENILHGRVTTYVGKHMTPVTRLVSVDPRAAKWTCVNKYKVLDVATNKYVKLDQMTRRREYEVRVWGAK